MGEKGYYLFVFDVIDFIICILFLVLGDVFILEFLEFMFEDEVVDKYEEYDDFVELKDDCKCGIDFILRLIFWEVFFFIEVINFRGEG